MNTRVKFCGMCRPDDARTAAELGVDAVGVVFYPKSPSAVGMETALAISQALPPFVELVALLVNAEPDYVREVAKQLRPGCLQFHGDENGDYCRAFDYPYIKACRVSEKNDIAQCVRDFGDARGILLDAKQTGYYGGSGKSFDWSLLPNKNQPPIVVAGGLSADNVGELISKYRPFAVDVSSGIAKDDDRKIKDHDKMKKFMETVQHANKQ